MDDLFRILLRFTTCLDVALVRLMEGVCPAEDPIAPGLFGMIQGLVRLIEQFRRRIGPVLSCRNAEAGGDD